MNKAKIKDTYYGKKCIKIKKPKFLIGQKIPHSLAMLILELPTLKIDIFNVQKLYLVFENNGTGPNHFIFNIIYEIRGLSIGFLAGTIR